ncbi:MAG: nuclear transport factor 2 family protein [Cyclobacteriaceae bacterium]|nr:nuclear transport factor 2 family protein [Cyclobacteriaceae bacterium]
MEIKSKFIAYTLASLATIFVLSCEQPSTKESNEEHEHAEGMEHSKPAVDTAVNLDQKDEIDNVKSVLRGYKTALENLNVDDTEKYFTSNSEILETGKVEGSYQDYIAHHIGPELSHFKSFTYNNYKVNVIVDGDYAFGTETYVYVIVLKEGERVIEKQGAATSVLHKEEGIWKIMKSHNSSRAVKKTTH